MFKFNGMNLFSANISVMPYYFQGCFPELLSFGKLFINLDLKSLLLALKKMEFIFSFHKKQILR